MKASKFSDAQNAFILEQGWGITSPFSVRDSVDRESVGMGSEYVETATDVPVHLTIVADWDVTDGIVFHEIEVNQKTFTVDIGFVDVSPAEEPNYD